MVDLSEAMQFELSALIHYGNRFFERLNKAIAHAEAIEENSFESSLAKREMIGLFCKLGEVVTYFRAFQKPFDTSNPLQTDIYTILNSDYLAGSSASSFTLIKRLIHYRNQFYHVYPYLSSQEKKEVYNKAVEEFKAQRDITSHLLALLKTLETYYEYSEGEAYIATTLQQIYIPPQEEAIEHNKLIGCFQLAIDEINELEHYIIHQHQGLLAKYELGLLNFYENIGSAVKAIDQWWEDKGQHYLQTLNEDYTILNEMHPAAIDFYESLKQRRRRLAHNMREIVASQEAIDDIDLLVTIRDYLLAPWLTKVKEEVRAKERIEEQTRKAEEVEKLRETGESVMQTPEEQGAPLYSPFDEEAEEAMAGSKERKGEPENVRLVASQIGNKRMYSAFFRPSLEGEESPCTHKRQKTGETSEVGKTPEIKPPTN